MTLDEFITHIRETAAEFVVRYHRARMSSPGGKARLFVTTNLSGEEIAERYTARLTSRIVCVSAWRRARSRAPRPAWRVPADARPLH